MRIRIPFVFFVLAILFFTSCTANPNQTSTTQLPSNTPVSSYKDIPYVQNGDELQVLDIYTPMGGNAPYPVVMLIKGFVDSRGYLDRAAKDILENGYAVVNIEFRLDGEHGVYIQDAFCALAWLHNNANQYNLDQNKIILFGHSLGGSIAALVAGVDEREIFLSGCPHLLPNDFQVLGVATYGGSFISQNLTDPIAWIIFRKANNLEIDQVETIFKKFDQIPLEEWSSSEFSELEQEIIQQIPGYWINGNEPPFLLLNGANDEEIPSYYSEGFAQILSANGVDYKLLILPDGKHDLYPRDVWKAPLLDFLVGQFED